MTNGFLLDIAFILLFTKLFGVITQRFKLPQVVGALIAGVIMGPAGFNIVKESDFISKTAEMGVIVLMFNAGLESDMNKIKNSAKDFIVIATFGVIVPLVLGTICAAFFNGGIADKTHMLEDIFIGSILTATSVSITVETLKEMGKMREKSANAIIGAAVVDDILGILLLTIITGMSDSSVSILSVVLKIIAFFIFIVIVNVAVKPLFEKWVSKYGDDRRRFVIVAFVLCLLMSYAASEYFSVADITGAYAAGIILSQNKETNYLRRRFDIFSYILFTPVFFANIGINSGNLSLDSSLIIFTIVLIVAALLSKMIGCSLGAKICGYSNKDTLKVGVGMIPRGEVALVIASKGIKMGVLSSRFVGPVIVMVIVAAISAPVLLKVVYNR